MEKSKLGQDKPKSDADLVEKYKALLGPTAEELMDFKFPLTKNQRVLASDLEQATYSRSHYDFFTKCMELLKRHPELVLEARKIPVPSLPPRKTRTTRGPESE